MLKDLVWIKKHYGEKMMHLCRELFPVVLEREGELPKILDEHFARNRNLASDIINENAVANFKDFVYSFFDVENENKENTIDKSAIELLDDAGYILYPECESEEDIQSFKKYWAKGEELCTFNGNRLKNCRVWFAIKNNIDEIKREDFSSPSRQDEYGTSAISIQFSKSKQQYLSIKNRYNHTVNNPDNTFNNNLDNIIPGLTEAFERDYGVRDKFASNRDFEMENYLLASDGKYYHYNYEINNIYYCTGGVVIDNDEVKKLPEHQMLIDYFVVDFKEKTINNYLEYINDDSFPQTITDIDKMEYNRNLLKIWQKDGSCVEIGLDENSRIVSYKNDSVAFIPDNFMCENNTLKSLSLQQTNSIGDDFLTKNIDLEEFVAPNLSKIGDWGLWLNTHLKKLDLPNLALIGDEFMRSNEIMEEFNAPKLQRCGPLCFFRNKDALEVNLPSLKSCGGGFFRGNKKAQSVYLPSLEHAGGSFMSQNEIIKELDLPNLKKCEDFFMCRNKALSKINVPKLEYFEGYFLDDNQCLKEIDLSSLREFKSPMLSLNKNLEKIIVSRQLDYDCYQKLRYNWDDSVVCMKNTPVEKSNDNELTI